MRTVIRKAPDLIIKRGSKKQRIKVHVEIKETKDTALIEYLLRKTISANN